MQGGRGAASSSALRNMTLDELFAMLQGPLPPLGMAEQAETPATPSSIAATQESHASQPIATSTGTVAAAQPQAVQDPVVGAALSSTSHATGVAYFKGKGFEYGIGKGRRRDAVFHLGSVQASLPWQGFRSQYHSGQ